MSTAENFTPGTNQNVVDDNIFMPPTSLKLGEHIALGLSGRLYVTLLRPLMSFEPCLLGF